jgi:hypothetical protein
MIGLAINNCILIILESGMFVRLVRSTAYSNGFSILYIFSFISGFEEPGLICMLHQTTLSGGMSAWYHCGSFITELVYFTARF